MPQRSSRQEGIPRLESGDRLSRSEFERRYAAAPDPRRAELIEGVVFVASPTRATHHGRPHAQLLAWLVVYSARTPSIDVYDNTTLRLDLDNEPQPDAILRLRDGGRSRVNDEDYLEGAPELVAEVAASSASYDLGVKKSVYRRNGVMEYLVWDTFDRAIHWFSLRDATYEPLEPAGGILRSVVFPGLWLDADALVRGDMMRVLEIRDEGLRSTEHAAFRAGLERR